MVTPECQTAAARAASQSGRHAPGEKPIVRTPPGADRVLQFVWC